jgi:hypothetical protein
MNRRLSQTMRRYWRPIQMPSLRELAAAIAIYLTLGALGWSLLTADPRAAGIAGVGLLLLSKLIDRPAPSTRKEPTRR